MKNQKLISSLLFLLIFGILSFFFGQDYLDFQEHASNNAISIKQTQEKAKNFKLNDISTIKDPKIFYTPYPELLENIVQKINTAEKRVFLEVYMFTETRIRNAIKNAKKRGLDVKVILEKNPYKSGGINKKAFAELQKSGVEVVWSDPKDYSLNHSKFFIIDDEIIISTGNMTYSTFKHNRDFFIIFKNNKILKNIEQIFANDFAGEEVEIYDENLVVSPHYSRKKIETLLLSAEREIKIYMQYLQDKEMNTLLKNLAKEGKNIQIIINQNNKDDKEIKELENTGIEIQPLQKIKMHSKVIIIDSEYAFIGSENFSSYSLDKNREMGIILDDKKSIDKILEVFKKDWK